MMYKGDLVSLRRLTVKDASTILAFWNNYEVRQYLPTPLPTSHEEMVSYIESSNEAFSQRKGFTFGIQTLDTEELVGIVNLGNISWISHNGEIGVLAIYNPDHWGKGYARDAMKVLLDIAFNVIDLHNVYLWVVGYNDRAIRFYEKIGFKVQGKLRELAFRNGKQYDVVVMDILKPEFIEKYGILPKNGAII